MSQVQRTLVGFAVLFAAVMSGCSSYAASGGRQVSGSGGESEHREGASGSSPAESALTTACQVTEPVWLKPPEDAAIQGSPEHGYYFVNDDRSIWASAWWTEMEDYHLRAGEEGIKIGWFRPAGATLEITGQRLDGQAPPLDAHVPCCYPTRFQASGLLFPTEGCWQVTAKAADSQLSFVVRVDP